jgi:outer membrane lipoprotein carrier protein
MRGRVGARISAVIAAAAFAGATSAAFAGATSAAFAGSTAAGQPAPSQPAPPAPGCGAEVAARVQLRYDGIRSLRARFTQTSRNVAFGGDAGPAAEPARGRVEFAKPGRMRFEYETPEPSLVVSDGKTLWIYDPVAKEVQVLAVEGDFLSAAAIQFLLGEGRLSESFEVTAKSCAPERAELELRPRAEASYERIDLVVDPATGWIRETTVHDLLGNRTQVAFEAIEAGGAVDEARFRFEPPEGVRVLTLEREPR